MIARRTLRLAQLCLRCAPQILDVAHGRSFSSSASFGDGVEQALLSGWFRPCCAVRSSMFHCREALGYFEKVTSTRRFANAYLRDEAMMSKDRCRGVESGREKEHLLDSQPEAC